MTCIEFQLHSTFPMHIAKLGYSPATYGMLLSINGLMIVFFELLITSWSQRLPPQPMIAVGYGLTGIGFAMTGIADNLPFLAFTVVIWTLGEMSYAPVTGAFVSGLAPERYRGRYMGLWAATWSSGMLLGPFVGTQIYAKSPTALWITCFIVGMIGAGLAMVKPGESGRSGLGGRRGLEWTD
jgi:MFS family permease